MSKRNISYLASVLANKAEINAEQAEKFIKNAISLLNDALKDEKNVKVKGLGTFKVITTQQRESVDVNSGKRIVIAGRDKITYTPDTALKDRINRPFAQFEPTQLNDGVTIPNTETVIDNQKEDVLPTENVEVAEQVEAVVPEIAALGEFSQQDETPSHENPTPQETIEESTPAEPVVPETEVQDVAEEPVAVETQPEVEESVVENQEEPTSEVETNEPSEDVVEPAKDEAKPVEEVAETPSNDEPTETPKKRSVWPWIILALLALGVIGFLLFNKNGKTENQPKPIDSTVVQQDTTVQEKEEVDPQVALIENANKYPGVRLGAYKIVGIEKEVTVLPGQTFAGISKAYFGPGMQCYLEAVNNGIKSVEPGQKILIPKVQAKKTK